MNENGKIVPYVDMNEIVDGLWLGAQSAADNKDALESRGIYHILSLREPQVLNELKEREFKDRTYHRIWIRDRTSADLSPHFLSILTIITDCQEHHHHHQPKRRPLLVHCHAGYSRSPSAVAAYLVHRFNLKSVDEALNYICKSGRDVDPNDGFRRQLEIFTALRPDIVYFDPQRQQRQVLGKSRRARRSRRPRLRFVITTCETLQLSVGLNLEAQ